MYAKLLGFLLFACQIVLNGSHFIRETTRDITNVAPTLASAPSTLPEGYVRFPDLHAAYKVYRTGMSWDEARHQCIAEGADLAIADTVEKIKRIYAMQSGVTRWISVGIRRSNITAEDWVRVDNGLSLASVPWSKNNPDKFGNCTGISVNGISLVNLYCDLAGRSYVCEIPIVPVINSTPTPAPAPSTLPEGYVRFPDLHSAYKVYRTGMSWDEARHQCIAEGADLAIADTVEKIKRIYAMQSGVTRWISVGIRKSNTTKNWVRIDNGLSLASVPWSKNNPDKFGNCTGISYNGISLVNFYCDLAGRSYVCEIPIVPVTNSTPTPAPAPSTLPEGYASLSHPYHGVDPILEILVPAPLYHTTEIH